VSDMGLLRVVVWSVFCFGLGVAAATIEIGAKTPVQHAWGLLETPPTRATRAPARAHPSERHTEAERDAIDALIGKRAAKRD
jgi:hypothetical protein